jgi:hypothetical protein
MLHVADISIRYNCISATGNIVFRADQASHERLNPHT